MKLILRKRLGCLLTNLQFTESLLLLFNSVFMLLFAHWDMLGDASRPLFEFWWIKYCHLARWVYWRVFFIVNEMLVRGACEKLPLLGSFLAWAGLSLEKDTSYRADSKDTKQELRKTQISTLFWWPILLLWCWALFGPGVLLLVFVVIVLFPLIPSHILLKIIINWLFLLPLGSLSLWIVELIILLGNRSCLVVLLA